MASINLILATSLALCGPVFAGPEDKLAEKINPDDSLSDLKKSIKAEKEKAAADIQKLNEAESGALIDGKVFTDPSSVASKRKLSAASVAGPSPDGGGHRVGLSRGARETSTVGPSERVQMKERATSRGMSLSGAKAMNSALRAAEHLKQVMPQFGDQAGGDAPTASRDSGLPGARAYGDAIGSRGLDARAGSPAQTPQMPGLGYRPSAEPGALSRYPAFFSAISRERYTALKSAYGTPGNQSVFRDIALTPTARDFLWSRSCSSVAGDCNPYASASYYKKGDYVPPNDLDSIWNSLPVETSEDALADSEYSDEEKKDAAAALGGRATIPRQDLSSLLARAQASVNGWLGDGPREDAASGSPVQAPAIYGATGLPELGARFAYKSGHLASVPGMKEGPAGFVRSGPRSLLTNLLYVLGLLLLIAGIVRRRG